MPNILNPNEYMVIKIWMDYKQQDNPIVKKGIMEKNGSSQEVSKSKHGNGNSPDFVVYFYSFFKHLHPIKLSKNSDILIDGDCHTLIPSKENFLIDTFNIIKNKRFGTGNYSELNLIDKLILLKLEELNIYKETKDFFKKDETIVSETINKNPFLAAIVSEIIFQILGAFFLRLFYFSSIALIVLSSIAFLITIGIGLYCKEVIYSRKIIVPDSLKKFISSSTVKYQSIDDVSNKKGMEHTLFYSKQRKNEKACVKSILFLINELKSDFQLHCNQFALTDDVVYNVILDTLAFLTEPPEEATTLEAYLADTDVPNKVAAYIQQYLKTHTEIYYITEDHYFYERIKGALVGSNIARLEFIGWLRNSDPDKLIALDEYYDKNFHGPLDNKCFSMVLDIAECFGCKGCL